MRPFKNCKAGLSHQRNRQEFGTEVELFFTDETSSQSGEEDDNQFCLCRKVKAVIISGAAVKYHLGSFVLATAINESLSH